MTEAELPPPFVPDGARRLLGLAADRKRHVVAAWAVVITAGSIAHFQAQTPKPLLPTHSEVVSRSIAVLDRGGPPLLTSSIPYRPNLPADRLAPIAGDDTGVALYLPLLEQMTGERRPGVLMSWLFTGAFGLLVLTVPIVVFELFGSLLAALVAPLFVLWQFEGTQAMDIYWVDSWCLLLCVPPLVLAVRWWQAGRRRVAGLLLAALALAAGFASAIRTHAGLAVIIGGVAVVLGADLVAERRLPRRPAGLRPRRATMTRLGLAALLVLAYLLPSVLIPAAAAAYRDATVHAVSPLPGARSHRPQTDIPLGGLLGDALRRYWPAVALLALGLALARRRAEAAAAAVLLVPAFVVGATALRVVPDSSCALGWAGAWGTLLLLGIGWTLADLGSLPSGFSDRRLLRSVGGGRLAAVATVVVIVGVAAAGSAAAPTTADSFHRFSRTPYTLAPLNVAAAAAWTFPGRLAPGWRTAVGATTAPDVSPAGDAGLFVKTAQARPAAALVGLWQSVTAGTYLLAARAYVLGGGIRLTATTPDGKVLASSRFWWNQRNLFDQPMAGVFTLRARTLVRITLANWASGPEAAQLVLRRLSLERLRPTGTYYAPLASRLVPSSSLHGVSEHVWPINGGTPPGIVTGNPAYRQYALPGGILIVTSNQRSQVQLFSEPVVLSPGRHRIVVEGKVKEGGLEVDAADARNGHLLAERHFWFAQDFDRGAMAVSVTLREKTAVRILLRNWAPETAASEWQLSGIEVQRIR